MFTSRSKARGSMSWLWQRGMRALALLESERAYWDVLGCPTSSLQTHVIHFAIKTLLSLLNFKVLSKFLDTCDPEFLFLILTDFWLHLKYKKNWKKYKKQYFLWFILTVTLTKSQKFYSIKFNAWNLIGLMFSKLNSNYDFQHLQ